MTAIGGWAVREYLNSGGRLGRREGWASGGWPAIGITGTALAAMFNVLGREAGWPGREPVGLDEGRARGLR